MKKIVLALMTVLLLTSLATADTIYLRDGRTVHGTLIGFINGRFVVRVSTRTSSGAPTTGEEGEIQFFRPGEVDRIEIDGRSLDELRFETRTVQVSLAPDWIDSGIDLRRNERVQINASGTILAGRTRITPGGLRSSDPTAPLPRSAEGVLIGAVGNDPDSPILELGLGREFIPDRDGRLYLTANRGAYTDARGAFTVQIRRERDLATQRDDRNDDPFNWHDDRAPTRSRTRQATNDYPRNRTPREATFEVPGTSRGTDTNIDVRSGDQVTITASGAVIAGRRVGQVGPEGGRATGFGGITRPVSSSGPGALIGFIRLANGQSSQPFLVGSQLTLSVPVDGRLFLAINDDDYSDNGGAFSVRIRY